MKIHLRTPAPMTQSEFDDWLTIIKYALGSRASFARLIGKSPMTISRWYHGDAPTDWWWREVFVGILGQAVDRLRHMASEAKREERRNSIALRINHIQARIEAIGYTDTYYVRQAVHRGEAIRAAEAFLRKRLKNGRVEYSKLLAEARAQGISLKTLGRAREALGVMSIRSEYGAKWQLPEGDDD